MKYDIFETQRRDARQLDNGLKVLARTNDKGKIHLQMWQPKAKKPFYNYLIDPATLEKEVETHKARLDSWIKIKQERKEEHKITPEKLETVKEGDIFKCSWGWEQTNVDFYKVVRRVGRKVTVIKIGYKVVSNDTWGSGKVVPLEKSSGEEHTYTLGFYKDEPLFKISSFETAGKWNGKPCYFSTWA